MNASSFRRSLSLAAALLACAAAGAQAQGVLTGRVTGANGEGVASAYVRLTAADGLLAATARSGPDGRYHVTFPGPGTRFGLWVERIGYAHASVAVERAPGASAVRDVRLAVAAAALAPVEARATTHPYTGTRVAPGGRASLVPQVEAMPLEPGDLGGIAARGYGAVLGAGGEGASAVSIAGQDPSQNRTVVDGASFGGASLPAEAVRAVGVATSTYDVARGQFAGGQLSVATLGGANQPGGALTARGRPPLLPWGAPGGAGWETGTVFLSGGYGGALRHDRLFAFGAVQAARRWAPSTSLAGADRATLLALGVAPDSLRRLEEVIASIGAPVGRERVGANSSQGSALVRFDWTPTLDHTVTLRLDGRSSRADGLGSPLGWAGRGGWRAADDGGALLAWTAQVPGSWRNELRAYASGGRSTAAPYLDAPSGTVRVAGDGGGVERLEFGGDPLRSATRRRSHEVADDFQLPLAAGAQQLKLGLALQEERVAIRGAAAPAAAWSFSSLAELEAGVPALYTRTPAVPPRTAATRYLAAYAAHGIQPTRRLSVAYGVRAEAFGYAQDGAENAPEVLGLRPRTLGGRIVLSPRAGFTYDLGPGVLRGGVGRFFGRTPLTSLAFALGENGTQPATLVCAGAAAPRPQWSAYADDPGATPDGCAGGAPSFAQAAPAVTVLDRYTPPFTWRGSLAGEWNPVADWNLGMSLTWARGGGEPLAFDRNLAAAPVFALASEGGRPVYAAPWAIDPATGAVAPAASRVDPAYATVREVRAEGRSGAAQITLSAARRWGSRIAAFSYTWTDAWNERSALGALASAGGGTAGDPRAVERGPADFSRRHALSLTLNAPLGRAAAFGFIGRLVSGLPYTPLVAGDVNGDGSVDDRAFIFPSGVGEEGAAMARLLDGSPAGAARCLRAAEGRVAGRNACRGPWLASLDAQMTLSPGGVGESRRVRLRVTATNLAGGADYLLHGAAGLRGWGQMLPPDAVLLYVRGFDPGARAFRYDVNPHFGRPLGRPQQPFGLSVEARIRVGSDPARRWLADALAANRRYARPPSQIAAGLAATLPNVPAAVLAAADSGVLSLASAQRERLAAQAAAARERIDSLIAVIAPLASAADTSAAGHAPDELRRLTALARALLASTTADAQAALSPDQWARLPAAIRERSPYFPVVPPKPIIIETGEP